MTRNMQRGPVTGVHRTVAAPLHRTSQTPVQRAGSTGAESIGKWFGDSLESSSADAPNTDPGFGTTGAQEAADSDVARDDSFTDLEQMDASTGLKKGEPGWKEGILPNNL